MIASNACDRSNVTPKICVKQFALIS